MPRYKLTIEYDGRPYHGWQRQNDLPSVQQVIEDAAWKLDPDASGITGAGRTDTGVHGTGQVAHIDMSKEWDPFKLMGALNFHMKPAPVAILASEAVHDAWHARFDAIERRYRFRIINRRAPSVLTRGLAWRVANPLDVDAMQEGANHLLGHHDFTTFRSTMCQAKSPVKTLDRLDVVRVNDEEIQLEVVARSFLHNQVRSFVGTLERVGAGKWKPERVKEALEAKNRAACGPVSPPDGLYLEKVIYPA